MVLVFTGLVYILSDLALTAPLVQRLNLTEADRSTVFWVSLGAGAVFTVLGVAISGVVAGFYGEPEVQPLFVAVSFSFAITALATVQSALLVREMDFRSLELRAIVGTIAGAAVAIAAALAGAGAWALIANHLTTVVLSTALLWRFSTWRPHRIFSAESLRSFRAFSLNVLGNRLLLYFQRSVDTLAVGRALGPRSLGEYSISYNLVMIPFAQIAGPVQEVLYPAFARIQQDRARMANLWLTTNRLVAAICLPALGGLAVLAPDIVEVLLGDQWDGAVPAIRGLAIVGALQSLGRLNMGVLQALDQTHKLVRYAVVAAAGTAVGVFAGLPWGVVGVVTGYAISAAVVEGYYLVLTTRALGISVSAFVRSIAGVVAATAVMVVATAAISSLTLLDDVGAWARVAILTCFGIAVFAAVCHLLAPKLLHEAWRARTLGRSTATV
jgi:O-antigen/teichoic acid export membrane protein